MKNGNIINSLKGGVHVYKIIFLYKGASVSKTIIFAWITRFVLYLYVTIIFSTVNFTMLASLRSLIELSYFIHANHKADMK